MIEVYYYIPVEEAGNAVECGLKLSKWFDKEVVVNGEIKKCISALLNPRDDLEKFRSAGLKCIKLELSPSYCFVADNSLYEIGTNSADIMKVYEKSVIPAENYVFGTYRMPECLVTCTVIPGQISALDRHLDSPILYNNSEELYVNNIIEGYKEENIDFNDTMLYCFYSKLSEEGVFTRVEDKEKGLAAFTDVKAGKVYTIKIPDLRAY
ncbi:MAG: hypothetical protein N3I35_11760 [Clostridia bacterium]|nr:hypothetical protein [Clostridia bacterium]